VLIDIIKEIGLWAWQKLKPQSVQQWVKDLRAADSPSHWLHPPIITICLWAT